MGSDHHEVPLITLSLGYTDKKIYICFVVARFFHYIIHSLFQAIDSVIVVATCRHATFEKWVPCKLATRSQLLAVAAN